LAVLQEKTKKGYKKVFTSSISTLDEDEDVPKAVALSGSVVVQVPKIETLVVTRLVRYM